VLINTCTQEAFDGIFEALDLLDEQPTEVEGLGTSGRSFVYEWTLRPDYRLNTKNTKRILGCIKLSCPDISLHFLGSKKKSFTQQPIFVEIRLYVVHI